MRGVSKTSLLQALPIPSAQATQGVLGVACSPARRDDAASFDARSRARTRGLETYMASGARCLSGRVHGRSGICAAKACQTAVAAASALSFPLPLRAKLGRLRVRRFPGHCGRTAGFPTLSSPVDEWIQRILVTKIQGCPQGSLRTCGRDAHEVRPLAFLGEGGHGRRSGGRPVCRRARSRPRERCRR